ncbi:endonuclease/exonuclease/phosphatase family protein [Candidatus Bipolaricaulota bacterium]
MKAGIACLIILFLASTAVGAATRTIAVAYFNALRFGQGGSMCKDIELLTTILGKYDVIALGEVKRNTGGNEDGCAYGDEPLGHVDALVDALNEGTSWSFYEPPWRYVASKEPVGRSAQSEEYYVVVYREDEVHAYNEGEIIPDNDDVFIRPPFAVTFGAWSFDFTLVVVHAIGPDNADELEASTRELDDVYRGVRFGNLEENDVILLGDFNVSSSRDQWWEELRAIDGMQPLITENTSLGLNSLANPYDKIWINTNHTSHEHDMFCGSGVDRYWLSLFPDMTYEEFYQSYRRSISDHLPVWAEFRVDLPDDDT